MHIPVLLKESIDFLNIQPQGRYIDLTTGFGGHSFEILTKLNGGTLICVDRDIEALEAAKKRLEPYIKNNKVIFENKNYAEIKQIAELYGKFDGVLADLGVSSYQLDKKERGFSYRYNYDLDMRMDINTSKKAINLFEYPVEYIVDILWKYGEVRGASKLANNLKKYYLEDKLKTTFDLNKVINETFKSPSVKLFSQIYQAIRIWTNDELSSLEKLLTDLPSVLNKNARVVIITYHSLEDRLVKNKFNEGMVKYTEDGYKDYSFVPYYKKVVSKVIKPSKEEIAENSRARSAKLRVVEKI